MALIEVQIRTDRLCRLIEGEVNSQELPSPTVDHPAIAGKLIERIECKDCKFAESWADDVTAFESTFVFYYYSSLETQVRSAGSFGVGTPFAQNAKVYIGLRMKSDNNWRIEYELLLGHGILSFRKGVFPISVPSNIVIAAAELIGTQELVSIRIATNPAELTAPVVNKLEAAEWCQTVSGELIAEEIRKVLDKALDDAVAPPPQPPSWEWWKPKPKHKELRKDGPARAAWFTGQGYAVAQGDITAVDACLIADIDVGIELTLTVTPQVMPGNALRTVATLTWDADSTWCSIATGLLLGFPVGIAVAVLAENEVSETILGKKISSASFNEIGRDDDSITFEKIAAPPPPPSREFEIAALAIVTEGIRTSGTIRPKVRARLEGSATPPQAGISIDCNIRAVGLKFNPAEAVLWSMAGDVMRLDVKPKPRVFLDNVKFEPPNAWKIEAKDYLKLATTSTPGDVLLVLRDPDTGRLPAGTATSMYLPTNLGVRWIDLGTIPEMDPEILQVADAEQLMNRYCDSIANPWAEGLTQLEWVDPLVDPDYDYRDRLRFWALGLQDLPSDARIEVLATSMRGGERLLGVVEGMKEVVLEALTSPEETLAFRVRKGFHASRPSIARGWFVPTRGLANHEEYVRDNLPAASAFGASDSERAVRRRRPSVDWATMTRLKTGEQFVKHGKELLVGVIRGIERIQ
jgi:hypothetical protein